MPDGDVEGCLGNAMTFIAIIISDDQRDENNQDEKLMGMTIDIFCRIPSIVNKHWIANERNRSDPRKMGLAVVEEYGLSGISVVDGCCRLLAIGSVIARMKAGNDATYDWYVEECIRWETHSYAIRERNMKDVSIQELLEHRYVEGACSLFLSMSVVFSGVPVSHEAIYHPVHETLKRKASLHLCLLNDITSYDREVDSVEGLQNFVEYQRVFCSLTHNLEDALNKTIKQCNEIMDEFIVAWKEMQTKSEDMKFLAKNASRMMLGHIPWALTAPRYNRDEFLISRVALQ